jgi:hypothetical protein
MKKVLLQSIAIGCLSLPCMGQLEVSTAPKNKVAVLEEYTGIKCTWCPDGHKRANAFKASKPAGDVILVNIHTGSYANGSPDFRTTDGDAIAKIPGTGISGYPQGSMNRHDFGSGSTATNRGEWAGNGNIILTQASPVNVAIMGTIDSVTRELEVEVKAYYTETETKVNKLTVMLIQDSLYSAQTGSSKYPEMETSKGYLHMHMLRDVITTSATGELVSPTTKGTTITKKYKIVLPIDYKGVLADIDDMSVVAFIAQGDQEILSGASAPVTRKKALSIAAGKQIVTEFKIYPNPASSDFSASFSILQDARIGWKIIDMTGREILNGLAQKYTPGDHTIRINTEQLATGAYKLVMVADNSPFRSESFSIVK